MAKLLFHFTLHYESLLETMQSNKSIFLFSVLFSKASFSVPLKPFDLCPNSSGHSRAEGQRWVKTVCLCWKGTDCLLLHPVVSFRTMQLLRKSKVHPCWGTPSTKLRCGCVLLFTGPLLLGSVIQQSKLWKPRKEIHRCTEWLGEVVKVHQGGGRADRSPSYQNLGLSEWGADDVMGGVPVTSWWCPI